MSTMPRKKWFATCGMLVLMLFVAAPGRSQQGATVNATPTRETIEDAARDSCDGVSVIVRRCAEAAPAATRAAEPDDSLTRSRARARAAFDRRDRQQRQDALDAANAPKTSASAPSAANTQKLAPVVVTGNAVQEPPTVEEILQKALSPPQVSPNGTVTSYAPDGARIECIAKCIGPMCCVTLRALPDPAHQSNSIGR